MCTWYPADVTDLYRDVRRKKSYIQSGHPLRFSLATCRTQRTPTTALRKPRQDHCAQQGRHQAYRLLLLTAGSTSSTRIKPLPAPLSDPRCAVRAPSMATKKKSQSIDACLVSSLPPAKRGALLSLAAELTSTAREGLIHTEVRTKQGCCFHVRAFRTAPKKGFLHGQK